MKIFMLNIFGAAAALSLASTAASAAVYNFSITYDGASQSLDAGSDTANGLSLTPGADSFTIDLHADGNDYWEVVSNINLGIAGAFSIQDNATRTSNITTTLFLDGVQVAQNILMNQNQSSAHIGAQSISLLAGLEFDQMVVDVEFLMSTSMMNMISSDTLTFSFINFASNQIDYVDGAIPLPAAAFLFLAGLGGLTGRRLFAGK